MARLIITADIHGSLSTFRAISGWLKPGDALAIAGDLFDTRYGVPDSSDFRPDLIRKEFLALPNAKFYVYGNCDHEEFMAGYDFQCSFLFEGISMILNHGHKSLPDLTDYQIVIEGHSHVPRLDSLMGKIFLNPGSPVLPRHPYPSIAVMENRVIRIIDISTGQTVSDLRIEDILSD